MSSRVELDTVKMQVNIYRQLKEQLVEGMKRYEKQGKKDLAKIIAQSIA